MKSALLLMSLAAFVAGAVSVGATGCGSSSQGSDFGDPSNPQSGNPTGNGGFSQLGGGTGPDGGKAGGGGPCVNLQCQQHACKSGGSTTISGTVYDPAGKNPLYGIAVYVPNTKPEPFPAGASCASCGALYTGDPVATALTDADGKFTITNAPDGTNIPLVIQVGKWRMQTTIPSVTQCTANALPDKSLTLPKNHTVGDIPNIAISTGGADTLECLLSRIGLDSSEYGAGASGAGRLHIFHGDKGPDTLPGAPTASSSMWDSSSDLMQYDILLLSCEGHETTNMNQQALFDYAAAGGRIFASHFHYSWFNTGPFGAASLASWSTGSNDMGDISASIVTTLPNGQPFPKGQALQQWLGNVNALTNGELPIQEARHNADVAAPNVPSQSWIVADQNAQPAGATEYFSFDTPINAAPAAQCGRVVYSDLHVGAASGDLPALPVPLECAKADLSPQEKALEFMLFDLSSCITPNDQPPQPPSASGPTQ